MFLFASVTETQGMIINEAQACGLPTVAVRAYGVAEMVHDGEDGLLTEPEPEALARAALLVLQDDELRLRLGAGARRAAECIAAEAVARELALTYQDLVDGRRVSVFVPTSEGIPAGG